MERGRSGLALESYECDDANKFAELLALIPDNGGGGQEEGAAAGMVGWRQSASVAVDAYNADRNLLPLYLLTMASGVV